MKQDYKEYEEKIKMNDNLKFDAERGETRTYEAAGKKITCRAYLGIVYCERPADPVQKLNIFVPEAYGQGERSADTRRIPLQSLYRIR